MKPDISKAIEGHVSRNRELLALIIAKGARLGDFYPVEHHFWARTHEGAIALAAELQRLSYLLLRLSPGEDEDGTGYWNIEASISRTLEEAGSREISELLVRLADRYDSEYDGWGVSL